MSNEVSYYHPSFKFGREVAKRTNEKLEGSNKSIIKVIKEMVNLVNGVLERLN